MSQIYTETIPATFLQNLSQNANTHYTPFLSFMLFYKIKIT